MPQPDAAHPARGNKDTRLAQFVGDPKLAIGRPLEGHPHHRFFHRRVHPILGQWLLPADLGQRRLSAGLVQLLEAIKAVPAVAHDLASRGYVAQPFAQLQQSHLGLDHFLLRIHLTPPGKGASVGELGFGYAFASFPPPVLP